MIVTHIETVRVDELPQIIWVNIHTDNGIIGLGETWYAPTVVEAAIHDHFGPLIIGRDPRNVELHWESMFRLSDHAGYGGAEMRAISAIDMALWDIKGQEVGMPIYELLGGAVRKKIRVYATGMPYTGVVDHVRKLLDRGITAMKGGPTIPLAIPSDGQYLSPKDLDRALDPVRKIRDAVGLEMQIANDGHGKWTLPVAIRIAQAMEPYEIMWQEDLMPLLNPQSLRELQNSTKTPICISERLLGRWQFRHFIENGSARIVMPDLIWTGGISETHKVAILASSHQVPFAPHDATGPVNIFACAQVVMSSPNAMIQEFVPGFHEGWYGSYVDPNFEIEDGFLKAPELPGIGTRLKSDVMKRKDVHVKISDVSKESLIDAWETLDTSGKGIKLRTEKMEREIESLRKHRGPISK
ncbi:MAG: mandelate racemase/muconate lactonizing enzyme family protein [Dehalococcoidia bacterium]|jgi:L-alanine-DL-glutamate epimerase-like enolase superfamily enzyme|nr:mandelate racemase/muconate lactonizing enzyme family protein [Dehalococcoidia bacterium]MDP7612930.1 mandelate racemase/muconate lactonizing enzyme family protein [Dehalococcoidia bacterium]|tara:strand:+ start:56 stop:1291 length:1236 start_codon:yes stop_codon:yes gene_type:complete